MSLNIQDPDRGTGRTTRRAVAYAHLLVNHPGDTVFIRDHAGAKGGNAYLLNTVAKMLEIMCVAFKSDLNEQSITVIPLVRSKESPDV